MPLKPTPEKYCEYCNTKLERKRFPCGDIECLNVFKKRKYCNQKCMQKAYVQKRDLTKQRTARNGRYIAQQVKGNGNCEICGNEYSIDVHHKDQNTSNNIPENLQRLCRSCHMLIHRNDNRKCNICDAEHKALGYCNKHYLRYKKWGSPFAYKENQFCEVVYLKT